MPTTGLCRRRPPCCTASCTSGSKASPSSPNATTTEALEHAGQLVRDRLERPGFEVAVRAGPVEVVEHGRRNCRPPRLAWSTTACSIPVDAAPVVRDSAAAVAGPPSARADLLGSSSAVSRRQLAPVRHRVGLGRRRGRLSAAASSGRSNCGCRRRSPAPARVAGAFRLGHFLSESVGSSTTSASTTVVARVAARTAVTRRGRIGRLRLRRSPRRAPATRWPASPPRSSPRRCRCRRARR